MILACIFDLDGVICHTDEFHYRAWKELCDQYGWKFDRALNNQLRGVSRRESLGIILRANGVKLEEAECQALMDVKNRTYRTLLMTMTPSDLEADVVPTLERLHQKGVLVGLGSSSKNAPLILQRLGITSYFDAIVDGSMITHSKPNPEVFLRCASLLRVSPHHCVVVEDAVAGIQAAEAGGFIPVAYRLHDSQVAQSVRHAETFTGLSKLLLG